MRCEWRVYHVMPWAHGVDTQRLNKIIFSIWRSEIRSVEGVFDAICVTGDRVLLVAARGALTSAWDSRETSIIYLKLEDDQVQVLPTLEGCPSKLKHLFYRRKKSVSKVEG
jgi:hypothetical protein